MGTDIDWQHELDASIATGDDVPVAHYVVAGQRAVRRRRTVAAVAGLAAGAVVAGAAWGLAPGSGPASSEAPVATDPSRASSPTTAPERPVSDGAGLDAPWEEGDLPARTGPDGLSLAPGSVVHERVDNLYAGKASESVALDISWRGERWWMRLEWDGDGGAVSSTKPDEGLYESFGDFVIAEIRDGGMTSEPAVGDEQWYAGLVQWAGGEPRPRPGVEVVRSVVDPVPSEDSSIGLVLRRDGVTTWLLITLNPMGSSASHTDERDSGWATFDQWLADQVALATGEPTPTLVVLGDDSTVAPAQPGVEVIEQQADPDLPAYGTASRGATSAVALVQWQDEQWFVLAVSGRGEGPDAITTVAATKAGGATTLGEFVAFMADRADEGGMR